MNWRRDDFVSKFGLIEKTIQSIRSVFKKYNDIEKVVIYGSRAKGNYRQGSDIDIVLFAAKLTTTDLLKIENELDDHLLPYKIDLSLFHQIENDSLKEHILRVGVELQ